MTAKVFIDGSAGTTGLKISQRLQSRTDIELVHIDSSLRKDVGERVRLIKQADIAFLCLPDAAAIEIANALEGCETVVIDTSTAHRTHPNWTYGFAELGNRYDQIRDAKRIANPGCHASGFVSTVAPLVEAGVLSSDAELSCTSLTGYSGGGKAMIADYENAHRSSLLDAPRMYGLSQAHKHIPEMLQVCGIKNAPTFCPIVADYYAGMEVIVSVCPNAIEGGIITASNVLKEAYKSSKLIHFVDNAAENGFLSANALEGRDDMQITVQGSNEHVLLVSRFDNLGKGASGAAIQNMNIALGLDETTGLIIGENNHV